MSPERTHITKTGVVKAGLLIATDIILEGALKSGKVRASRWLELGPKAVYTEDAIQGRDLRIPAKAKISLRRKVEFRNVEVKGKLNAQMRATGLVTVQSGGCLKGNLQTEHLCVEEGGGLIAKLSVSVQDKKVAESKAPRKKKTAKSGSTRRS